MRLRAGRSVPALMAVTVMTICLASLPTPCGDAAKVERTSENAEAWRFRATAPAMLRKAAMSCAWFVYDDTDALRLCVHSGPRPLSDDGPAEFTVHKRQLVQSDDYRYRLVFRLLQEGGRPLFQTASKPFAYPTDADAPPPIEDLPAFPGAQGPGATTPAGRGGTVHVVTRLDDYAEGEKPLPGTLRYAVEQEGPRQVVFAVGGMLRLERPLVITEGRLTVAGNTAPFPGVTITRYPVKVVRCEDVVLRYLRVRLDIELMRERFAEKKDSGWDCFTGSRCEYVLFDHLSASHSVDETISFSPKVDRVTIGHCIAAYSLKSVFHDYYFSRGPNYKHTKRHNLGGLLAYLGKHNRHAQAAAHHTIYAHHTRRMPGMSAGRDEPDTMFSHIDLRNNLMYNWTDNAAGIETGSVGRSKFHINFVGNYARPGPDTPKRREFTVLRMGGKNAAYLEGNVHHAFAEESEPTVQERLVSASRQQYLGEPLPTPYVATKLEPTLDDLANEAVGCSLPCRDSLDRRVIRDIYEGTGHHPYVDMEKNTAPPVPQLATTRRPLDDGDPFPAWWKRMQGLPADTRIHPHADSAGDGYTNIEAYMHGLRLDREPVDWTGFDVNRNPLDDRNAHPLAFLAEELIHPDGWSNQEEAETTFVSESGPTVFVSHAVADGDGSHGCRALLAVDTNYWTPGNVAQHAGKRADGGAGARAQDGPAVVFAFPLPQQIPGIAVGKPDANAWPTAHDPKTVRIEGLRGWPNDWEDLTGAVALEAFTDEAPVQTVAIPEDRRAPFAAVRLVVTETGGAPVRIAFLSPVFPQPDDTTDKDTSK